MSARPGSRKRWIAGAALLCIIALLLSLGGCVDQSLTPESRALYAMPAAEGLRSDGGFAFVAGFDAPLGDDVRTAGARWISAVRQANATGAPVPASKPQALLGSNDLMCVPDSEGCIEKFRANTAWVGDLVEQNEAWLARYRELLGQADISDHGLPIPVDAALGSLGKIMSVQGVYLAQAALNVHRGRVDVAVDMIATDHAFFRRLMGQSSYLVGKMIAARGLIRNSLFASELARLPSITEAQLAALEDFLQPLTKDEMRMAVAMRHEAHGTPQGLDMLNELHPATVAGLTQADTRRIDLDDAESFWSYLGRHFVARNATLNYLQPVMQSWEALDAVDTPDIQPRPSESRRRTARGSLQD